MLFAIAAIATAGIYLQTPTTTDAPLPIVQLKSDLQAAVSHAHLTDAQTRQLEGDRAVFDAAAEAKQQGRPVDRQKVVGAVGDLRRILHSGAFTPEDKTRLDADIAVLRKQ